MTSFNAGENEFASLLERRVKRSFIWNIFIVYFSFDSNLGEVFQRGWHSTAAQRQLCFAVCEKSHGFGHATRTEQGISARSMKKFNNFRHLSSNNILLQMGITPMGDIISILRHSKTVTDQTARDEIMAENQAMKIVAKINPAPAVSSGKPLCLL